MIQQAAFEIVGQEGWWRWRLRDGETYLAHSAETFDSPEEAREHVERTRLYASKLNRRSLRSRHIQVEKPVSLPIVETDGVFRWQLRAGNDVVAIPPATYESEAHTRAVAERVTQLAVGTVPVLYGGSDETTERHPFAIDTDRLKRSVRSILNRGRRHDEFLDQLDARIVVMGIRGKSSTTRRIADVFDRRGYDTLVKITGNRPHVLHNGDYIPIERKGPRVTLYENIKTFWRFIPVLDSYSPEGVGVFENQGITEYTTRMFNQRFVDPDVILLTNVRQDHQDTMGKTRQDIARSFARSVPEGAHVVSGEQHPVLHEYLKQEVERVGGTLKQVDIPEKNASLIGAETVHAVNEVLEYLGQDPLPEEEVAGYLDAIQPEWTPLPGGGRIFNAAEVNDIESTEAVRRALVGDDPIVPFVYLRGDRRSRTASFADYVNTLVERGLVETVVAAGDYTNVFAANVNAPVTRYGPDADPEEVLDHLLSTGLPIVSMGNTVAEFMRQFEEEVDRRARRAIHLSDTEPAALPWETEAAEAESAATAVKAEATAVGTEETAVESEANAGVNAPVATLEGTTMHDDSENTDETTEVSTRRSTAASDSANGRETADAAVESNPRIENRGDVLPVLLHELDEYDLSESETEILADSVGAVPVHERAKMRHLQSQVADLTAYIDALEEFLDEEGTAGEILGSLESDVAALRSRVENLESEVGEAAEAAETDAIREELSGVRSDAETNADRLDDVRDELAEIRERTSERVGKLEATVSENSDRIASLQEVQRERLLREIREESKRIDDVESLNAALSEIRRKRPEGEVSAEK
ncbi:hypothetical protein [Halopelagius longus]|uniref:Mur ligase middle domain-containing protein n=1 Tax=Halopelagius longus TaxID=1236180 RepID=A0A1H0ZC56_9EURY|nr:hypothetical protein [Halopelagius longus]SDQ25000.1 hypothetical protein SAMN05216278_1136 [Halopelagius longus]